MSGSPGHAPLPSADAIREALHGLRYARSLEDSPLRELALVTRALAAEGMQDTPEARSWALARVLTETVAARLRTLRDGDAAEAMAPETEAAALRAFEADFRSGSVQREAWGALSFRYLAPVEQPVAEARTRGVPQSTLYRRVLRGCDELAVVLQPLERAAGAEGRGEGQDGEPSAEGPRPRPLPRPQTSLVGRDADLKRVLDLLDESRLVTLTGPGGTGKTRLAIGAAEARGASRSGDVVFVDLSSLESGEAVVDAARSALGLPEAPGRTPLETVLEGIGCRETLLLLDNCEHLLPDAAALADALLGATPGCRILATSREPLRAEGEHIWSLPPLALPDLPGEGSLPDPATLLEAPALRLFVERATHADADFVLDEHNAEAVARLCIALDGLPLALELSAARVRALTPQQQLARFDQLLQLLGGGRRAAQPRQRSLAAALDWSYDLLDASERRLFSRLAVFRGGWTLEMAETVAAGEPIEAWDVLEWLAQLVDKSLLRAEPRKGRMRYDMLWTVRSYALARLRASGEEMATRRRHLAWCLDVVEDEARKGRGAEGLAPRLARLDEEHENFRAALAFAEAEGDGASALRLAGSLGWSFYPRGELREGCRFLRQALSVPGGDPRGEARAAVLNHLGLTMSNLGDLDEARRHLRDAVELFAAIGDDVGYGSANNNLGVVAFKQGDLDSAQVCFEQIREIEGERPHVLANLALVAEARGDHAEARRLLESSLEMSRTSGNEWEIAHTLINLGSLERRFGDPTAARVLLEEGLARKRRIRDRSTVAHALRMLGLLSVEEGRAREARARFAEAAAIARDLGDEAIEVEVVAGLAALAGLEDVPLRAAALLGAADRGREELGIELAPIKQEERERLLGALRATAGTAAVEAAREQGRERSLDEAIQEGLAAPPEPDR